MKQYLTFIPSDFDNLSEPIQFKAGVKYNVSTLQYLNIQDCPAKRATKRAQIVHAYSLPIMYDSTKLNEIRRKLRKGAKTVKVEI